MWKSKKLRQQRLKERFGRNPLKDYEADWVRGRMDEIRIYHKELSGQNEVEYVTHNEDARIAIEERLGCIGKREDDYHLPTFLMHSELWKIKSGIGIHLLQIILILFLMGSIFLDNGLWVMGLIVVALTNLTVYLRVKQQYEVYLFSLGSLKEVIRFCNWMLEDEERQKQFATAEVENAMKKLKKLSKMMISWQNRKYAGITGDMLSAVNDYLMGITLVDVSIFNYIMKEIHGKQESVLLLYEFIGKIDISIAIASFRKSVDVWCQPTVWDTHEIRGKGIGHPLLEHPVTNDFSLRNRAIITGANASGKSTFMKALAINVLLAQTIHTCMAETFSMPKMFIMTSMSLRDDILSGESYYIREVKYLKRMLDQMQRQMPMLCVIDEILRGTNTKERLAASQAILEYLADTNSYVLIATHDMELVYDMKEKYEQYYFESRITEEDIQFDYRIQKGMGGKSNAIALLALMDFPKKIVTAAKNNWNGSQI